MTHPTDNSDELREAAKIVAKEINCGGRLGGEWCWGDPKRDCTCRAAARALLSRITPEPSVSEDTEDFLEIMRLAASDDDTPEAVAVVPAPHPTLSADRNTVIEECARASDLWAEKLYGTDPGFHPISCVIRALKQ